MACKRTERHSASLSLGAYAAVSRVLQSDGETSENGSLSWPHHRAGATASCRSQLEGRREAPGCTALPTGLVSSRRHIEPCMRFSRTRLTDVLHRRHSVGPA